MRSTQQPRSAFTHGRHHRAGHRSPPPGGGSRAAPLHRRPGHGARHRPARATARSASWWRSPWPGCPLRNEIQNRVTDGGAPARGRRPAWRLDFTVMTDQEREALRIRLHGDPAASAGATAAHGHAEGRQIPFAQPGSRTRPLLIASGKGGVGQVQRHHQPGRRPGPAGPLGRRRSTPTSTASPSPACSAPTASRSSSTRCSCRRSGGASGASRWATSCPRARPSSGGARCCTRPWSSSSPTSSGTTRSSCWSTCRPAPATSRSASASTCPGPRCSW